MQPCTSLVDKSSDCYLSKSLRGFVGDKYIASRPLRLARFTHCFVARLFDRACALSNDIYTGALTLAANFTGGSASSTLAGKSMSHGKASSMQRCIFKHH